MSQKLFYRLVGLAFNLWGIASPKSAAHGAYRLFGRPPKPSLRPKELQFIDTARQVRSTVAGYPVVEYHWGPENGEMILLVTAGATMPDAGAIMFLFCSMPDTGLSPTIRPDMASTPDASATLS